MNTGMKQFLRKLIPPRPTFAQDMTEVERKIMQEHIIYWKDLSDRGIAIIFGPVLDPIGTWGVAIVEAINYANECISVASIIILATSISMKCVL